MKQNLDKLWAELIDDGTECPSIDPTKIQIRVATCLNSLAQPKKYYVRKRLFAITVCAAILIALTGSALAIAYYRNTVISSFEGDTSLIEPAIQIVEEELEQRSYKITVDSVLSDTNSTIIGFTIDGLTNEAVESLSKKNLIKTLTTILRFEPETSSGIVKTSFHSIAAGSSESSRRISMRLSGVSAPNVLRIHLLDGTETDTITLTLDKTLESLSVTPSPNSENKDYFIRHFDLTAVGAVFEVEFAEPVKGDRIVEFYFRLADGSLKTLSQLCGQSTKVSIIERLYDTTDNTYRYTVKFPSLISPLSISGVIINDTEYSFLDPEYMVPAEVPSTLRPFLTPYIFINDVFYFSAPDFCEHLETTLEEESGQYTIRYLDTVLTCSPDSTTIILNGEHQEAEYPPLLQNGKLILPRSYCNLLQISSDFYYPEIPAVVCDPEYWLITP